MSNICIYMSPTSELYHHGIKGQRWGIRRFQNEDGSYTAEGKRRREATGEKWSIGKKVAVATLATVGVLAVADIASGGNLHRAVIDAGKKAVDNLMHRTSAQDAANRVNKALNEYTRNRQAFAKRESNQIAARNFRRRAKMYFRDLLKKTSDPFDSKAQKSMRTFLKNFDKMSPTFGRRELTMLNDFKDAVYLQKYFLDLDRRGLLEDYGPKYVAGFRVY